MSGPEVVDTETPSPPWRHRDERGRHFFQRLSDRTPLRTKLITAVLALVIVALAVISVASVVLLRNNLTTQQDPKLRTTFANAIVRVDSGTLEATPGETQITGSDMILGIQATGGQLTSPNFQGQNFPGMGNVREQVSLPSLPTGANWAPAPNGVLLTVPAVSGGDSWRVMAVAVPFVNENTGKTEPGTLVLAVDLGPVNADIERLAIVDLAVSGAIVIVLAMVAIAVVQANLRPLNDIELSAGQIAQGHLDHRVPEGDPRTEVGSLSRSLNAMLTQIERAFHAQEESEQAAHDSEERMRRFIADASHELRTPLTTIRGFAAHYRMRGGAGGRRSDADGGAGGRRSDVGVGAGGRRSDVGAAGSGGAAVGGAVGFGGGAEDQSSRTDALVPGSADGIFSSGPADDGMSPADLDHLIGRVEAEATRMGLLVEDLLMLARLDQQRPLNIAPVDVLTLAADAVQDARIVSPGRPIDLIVAPGTAFLVEGDEPRLRQVLANLVNNAITHTPAGTPVRVKIASGTLDKPHAEPVPAVVLDVEDDGPGMSAEQAQRVFERFYRADAARNRASGGTGLGLAIVAGLVNAHGGTVSVQTAPGEGADFQVKLPLSPDAQGMDPEDDDGELALRGSAAG
jgi:two-component system, OmpR family, sensor kinase